MNPVKIFLADDHQILIDGLKSFFVEMPEYEVIGTANDGLNALQAIQVNPPDILLLDLNMPRLDGIKTLEQIRKNFPRVAVIILSNYNQTQLVKEAKAKGAAGYVVKNGSMKDLVAAIEQVKQGGTYFQLEEPAAPNENSGFFLDEFMHKHNLSKREIEIIKLICQQLNSREIGEKLFISEFTVTTHRRNILQKLNLKNAAGVINFARDNGLIE